MKSPADTEPRHTLENLLLIAALIVGAVAVVVVFVAVVVYVVPENTIWNIHNSIQSRKTTQFMKSILILNLGATLDFEASRD